jgi:protein disulfide-isomerase
MKMETKPTGNTKMQVEVWSDIMCPFCYIGKRNYEAALAEFADRNNIEIVWKSFQLDPTIPQQFAEKVNVYQYLADRKGMSLQQSQQMHGRVVGMAKDAGLEYNFEKAVVANSFKAHRMIQMAKTKGHGDKAEERLFYAYFTEGKDFGSTEVLKELGNDIGLTETEVTEALTNDAYAIMVKQDIHEADSIGVNGVPFFVFNRRYAISGAQPPAAFLQTLEKSFAEWRAANPFVSLDVSQGDACVPGQDCV